MCQWEERVNTLWKWVQFPFALCWIRSAVNWWPASKFSIDDNNNRTSTSFQRAFAYWISELQFKAPRLCECDYCDDICQHRTECNRLCNKYTDLKVVVSFLCVDDDYARILNVSTLTMHLFFTWLHKKHSSTRHLDTNAFINDVTQHPA